MSIKVVRRSQVIFHSLLLIIFTVLMYFLVQIILSQGSLANLDVWIEFIYSNKLLFSISLLSFGYVFYAKRLGFLFLFCLCFYVLSLLIVDFTVTGNKGILIAGFVYFLCSYFVLMAYYFELQSPPFAPSYIESQVDNRKMPTIKIDGIDEGGTKYYGQLSKISGDALFSIDGHKNRIKGKISAKICFENNEFQCDLIEVTKTNFGRGFKVSSVESYSPFSWYNFHKLLSDRGYYFE